ncbi:MAG: carboxypeptidase-like regulatory domain-containing protein [Thermonemataceae bacterium]
MKNIAFYFIAAVTMLAFTSCGDDLTPDVRTNTLFGFVEADDEFGNVTDDEGFTVNLVDREGNSIANTVTDVNGRYEFPNVAFGTYEITFDKEGYNTYRIISEVLDIEGPAPKLLGTSNIKAASSTVVDDDFDINENFSSYSFSITLSPEDEVDREFVVFFSTSDDVSKDKYDYAVNSFSVTKNTLAQYFEDGQIIYAVAHGETDFSRTYEDPNTLREVYYTVNDTPSNVVSFTFDAEVEDIF